MPERQGLGQEFPNVRGQRPGQAPPLIIPCGFLKQILFLLLLGLNVDKWILKRISHGFSLYWGLGGILRVAEGQWKGGSGRWWGGRRSPEFQVDIQAWARRPMCLEAPGRRRESKGKLPGGKKINSLPKIQQKWPDLPRRRASSCGESLGWEEQRPFPWQPGHLQQVLAPA